jgi:hypothetical protein
VAQPTVHQALVESRLRTHLKNWVPSHLRRIAVENDLQPRVLGDPKRWSWPVASEFDLKPHERLPALLWHPTLDGLCEHVTWGAQDLAVGRVTPRSHRAVFGAQFDLVIPQAIPRKPAEEPSAPPSDPYEPPAIPPALETAEITVTSERLDDQ